MQLLPSSGCITLTPSTWGVLCIIVTARQIVTTLSSTHGHHTEHKWSTHSVFWIQFFSPHIVHMASIRQNKCRSSYLLENKTLFTAPSVFHIFFSQSSVHPTKEHVIAGPLSAFTSTHQYSSSKSKLHMQKLDWDLKMKNEINLLQVIITKISVLSKFVVFWLIFDSLNFAEVKSIALFSRLAPSKFDCFPSYVCFTLSHDLSADPILSLFDVTWQATKPRTLVLLFHASGRRNLPDHKP